jgi:hypothetical protein
MCGDFQDEFTHEITKISGARDTKPRINITFRQFKVGHRI